MNNNPFFTIKEAKLGKKKLNPILVLILATSLILIGQISGGLILTPMKFLQNSHDLLARNIFSSLGEIIRNVATVFLLFLWIRYMEKRPFYSIGFTRKGALGKYIKGLVWGLLLISICSIGLVLTGYGRLELQNVNSTLIWTMVIYLIAFLIQGAAEEILVRGWVLPVISARTRTWVGVLTSSLLFGVLHLLNPGITILSFLDIVVFGIFAALYVLKEGDLWGICGLHSSWNWAQLCIYGFLVSGDKKGEAASLFKPILTGPEIINGGKFGIEGSIITVTTYAIASSIVLFIIKKKMDAKSKISDTFFTRI